MRFKFSACGTALIIAGCTPVAAPVGTDTSLASVRAIGEPVDCIETNQILNTNVRNDRVVDFEMRNGQVYRNTLPNSCPGLGYQSFSYQPTQARLCSIDVVTVRSSSGQPGPTCGLSTFQRIEADGI